MRPDLAPRSDMLLSSSEFKITGLAGDVGVYAKHRGLGELYFDNRFFSARLDNPEVRVVD